MHDALVFNSSTQHFITHIRKLKLISTLYHSTCLRTYNYVIYFNKTHIDIELTIKPKTLWFVKIASVPIKCPFFNIRCHVIKKKKRKIIKIFFFCLKNLTINIKNIRYIANTFSNKTLIFKGSRVTNNRIYNNADTQLYRL